MLSIDRTQIFNQILRTETSADKLVNNSFELRLLILIRERRSLSLFSTLYNNVSDFQIDYIVLNRKCITPKVTQNRVDLVPNDVVSPGITLVCSV